MKEIIHFSLKYGGKIEDFQSSGGNISFKKDGELYIKSSGYKVVDIAYKNAISKVDLKIYDELFSGLTEEGLLEIIKQYTISGSKASIETLFHLLIPYKYIVHTHNIYINILLCSYEGEVILNKITSEKFQIYPYASPGKGIFDILKNNKEFEEIIFLKNHGIICSSNISFDDAYEKILQIEKSIREYLLLESFSLVDDIRDIQKYLFPDSVTFPFDKEVYSAHDFIEKMIIKNSLTFNYLSFENIQYLHKMSMEKYRKDIYTINI